VIEDCLPPSKNIAKTKQLPQRAYKNPTTSPLCGSAHISPLRNHTHTHSKSERTKTPEKA